MNIKITLTDDEAQAFKNWSTQVKPPQLDEDGFVKQIFFNGIASINQQISQMAQQSLKDPAMREQLRQAGIDVEQLEKEMAQSLSKATSEPLENPVTEITDPAAPVEVLPDGEQTTKTNTTQDATDTK